MASYKQTKYEILRRRCVALHQQGWKQVIIAQALGLTQGWVSRTLTKYQQQGQDGLAIFYWTEKLRNTALKELIRSENAHIIRVCNNLSIRSRMRLTK